MTDGIFLAEVQGEGVLLDLVGDRYVGLTALSTGMWRDLRAGLSPAEVADRVAGEREIDAATARTIVDRQVEAWRDAGLLRGDDPSLPQTRTPSPPASRVLGGHAPLTARAVLAVLRATAWVRWSLWTRGPGATVAALQSLDATDVDSRSALALRRAWTWLRRPLHQGRSDCWPRSLALVRALRLAGVDARLCLGVRKFPFLAHAWVEVGRVSVDEDPEVLSKLVSLARF